MAFPETRLTLIQRLASGGSEEDWRGFVQDYHGPICRFALRLGAKDVDDAEGIALEAFEVLWSNQLLSRWVGHQSAKLRSLLCAVVRNILSNRHRVQEGRRQRMPDVVRHLQHVLETREEQSDIFYWAWVEDLVQQSVETMANEYRAGGKGDYLRVFYGRLCQGLSIAEVSKALGLTAAVVDHYFREARDRLAGIMERTLREQIRRYCAAEDADEEFAQEWQQLREHLSRHGGLENAVRRTYEFLDPVRSKMHVQGRGGVAARLTTIIRAGPAGNS